jgi:CheY-like chemotaxis protein
MKTFFLADDDPMMVRLYERAFTHEGYEFVSASDGSEAIEKLSSMAPKPDVILLDVMMPKVNGYEVLRQIKEDKKLADIPVLMLTNLSGSEDMEKAFSGGVLDFLVKSDYSAEQVVEKAVALTKH